ncbi:hypothetical protein [Caldisalinibacter kiritimatiensis]|uniref:Uncharacterized protein n=1 Tax=Caldisalinibacter kiritimatiensis TaxID=1304284 RepID=R1CXD0_9FIRM|nr:hypothetical protein [Caldisalinibacter kiritimatiensis]EOD01284.1 hypothetical protein L21TH_0638 [Caldisalinibacter kiritimatiensis]
MFLLYIQAFVIMLFLVSVFGYVLVVLKEKLYLKRNIILIDKKSVKKEYIDEVDLKEFIVGGIHVRAGDEVKVILSSNESMEGIIIGANKKDDLILMVTHKDEIRKFRVSRIKKFKIISKYGKFFK